MKKINIMECFGGIGACSKALERLGIPYEIADYVEIDKYAVKSFNAMHNTNFEPQDICKWDKDIEVDLIMHGSPCQDFSLAGKQAGGDEGTGTRSSLMYETIRIVEKLKPKYVIWENVKNLLSKKHIHNFNAYLETMEQLGYSNYYQVLNAKDYGIPQNRERVFTISILGNENYVFPPKQELKLKLKDMLEDEVDEKYYLSEKTIRYITDYDDVAKNSGRNINDRIVNPKIAKTISCRGAADQRADVTNFVIENEEEEIKVKELKQCLHIKNATKKGYLEAEDGDGVDISGRMQYHRGTVQKGMIQTLSTCPQNDLGVVMLKRGYPVEVKAEKDNVDDVDIIGNYSKSEYGATPIVNKNGLVPTVRENHGQVTAITTVSKDSSACEIDAKMIIREEPLERKGWHRNAKEVLNVNGICRTLSTQSNNLCTKIKERPSLRIRKLTPKTCWRVMGFDDEDYEKASKVNSNTQLYKQAGNSIVVNVLEAILTNLLLEPTTETKGQMSIYDVIT